MATLSIRNPVIPAVIHEGIRGVMGGKISVFVLRLSGANFCVAFSEWIRSDIDGGRGIAGGKKDFPDLFD